MAAKRPTTPLPWRAFLTSSMFWGQTPVEVTHRRSLRLRGMSNAVRVSCANCGIHSYTTQILRLVAPILEGRWRSVEVKAHKEREYHDKLQAKIKQSIWSGSCSSVSTTNLGSDDVLSPVFSQYFIDSKTGKNWFIYPWSSFRMWYTTRFGSLRDWTYE